MDLLKVFGWQPTEFQSVTRGEHTVTILFLPEKKKRLILAAKSNDFKKKREILQLHGLWFQVFRFRCNSYLQQLFCLHGLRNICLSFM